jgi:uncharacterized membrane protein
MKQTVKHRINAIDALRGIAVLLMLQQHLLPWLWIEKWTGSVMLSKHPVLITINGLGGLAAPLFLVLSGFGSFFFISRVPGFGRKLAARGILIILFGYLLNILTPSWFSAGSWYILHMIGLAIIVSPLTARLSTNQLITAIMIIIFAALALQETLDMPAVFSGKRMDDYSRAGWIFRLAIAEGHFPVFPWLASFLSGALAGRWFAENNTRAIFRMSAILLSIGLVLSAAGFLTSNIITGGFLFRLFKLYPSFYPALAPITLILMGASLLLMALFLGHDFFMTFSASNPLVCLGRASLTILLIHIVVFKEWSMSLNFYKIFTEMESVAIMIALLAVFSLLSVLWSRSEYKYGAEWMIRKISDRA